MSWVRKRPDYKKIYPGISPEVLGILKRYDRKTEYMEYDLKRERCRVNQSKKTVQFLPSREDSYERLVEEEHAPFADERVDVQAAVEYRLMLEQLNQALGKLSEDERRLIHALFFEERTQCEISQTLGISQPAVIKRRVKILAKLKKFLEI